MSSLSLSFFVVEGGVQHALTISIGLVSYQGNQQKDWNTLVEKADHQLYRAKQEGRNQVCHSLPDDKEQQVSEDEKSALFDMFKERFVVRLTALLLF